MCRLFIQLILSQLILVSTKHIPEELADRIYKFMGEFFKDSSYEDLKKKLKERQYDWCAFTPVVKLLYVKSADEVIGHDNPVCATMKEIYLLSIRSSIMAVGETQAITLQGELERLHLLRAFSSSRGNEGRGQRYGEGSWLSTTSKSTEHCAI